MYQGHGQWYCPPIPRYHIYQGNIHVFLHPQKWGSPINKGHLLMHCFQHHTPEERNLQSVSRSWQQQNHLRWTSIHPHSWSNYHKTPFEQRPINPILQIPHNWCQELLPEKSNEEEWILQNINQTYSPRYSDKYELKNKQIYYYI